MNEKSKDIFKNFFAKASRADYTGKKGVIFLDYIDREQERQIWQRVAGNQEPVHSDLEDVLATAVWLAAAYRHLAGNSGDRETLMRLMETEKANIACMKGMLILSGKPVPQLRYPDMTGERRSRLLAQCVRQNRKEYMAYASRLAEPEFGAAFQVLAARAQEQLVKTLELLPLHHRG